MEALYDSQADAIAVTLRAVERGATVHGDEVHERAIVAVSDGVPVEVQLLYPTKGVEPPLKAAVKKYPNLELDGLRAAIATALGLPDQAVRVELIPSS